MVRAAGCSWSGLKDAHERAAYTRRLLRGRLTKIPAARAPGRPAVDARRAVCKNRPLCGNDCANVAGRLSMRGEMRRTRACSQRAAGTSKGRDGRQVTERLRVGVVGCGVIAQVMHLPHLRDLR